MSKRGRLRRAMMAAVTEQDVYEIVKLQVFLARKGDPMAVREVLDRTIGRPASAVDVTHAVRPGAAGVTSLQPADAEALAMDSTIPLVLPAPTVQCQEPAESDRVTGDSGAQRRAGA